MEENKFKTLYKFHCIVINSNWEVLVLQDKKGDSEKRKFRGINYKPTEKEYTKRDVANAIRDELGIYVHVNNIYSAYKFYSGVKGKCNIINTEIFYIRLDAKPENIKFNKSTIEKVCFLSLEELNTLRICTKGGYQDTLENLLYCRKIPGFPKVDLNKAIKEPYPQRLIDLLCIYYSDTHEEEINSYVDTQNDEDYEDEEQRRLDGERQYLLDKELEAEEAAEEDEFEGQRLLDEAEEIYEEEATDPFYDDDYNDTIWD